MVVTAGVPGAAGAARRVTDPPADAAAVWAVGTETPTGYTGLGEAMASAATGKRNGHEGPREAEARGWGTSRHEVLPQRTEAGSLGEAWQRPQMQS